MKTPPAILLLLVMAAGQDADRLVESLRSDDLEERDEAAAGLIEMGEKAVPALEKAAAGDDPALRLLAKSVLDRIAIVRRVRRETRLFDARDADPGAAVRRALDWLVRHQSEDGSWAGRDHDKRCEGEGRCRVDAGSDECTTGVTGLAVLALETAGVVPSEDGRGAALRKGLAWLVGAQGRDGRFGGRSTRPVLNHAIATLAVVEASQLFRDEARVEPAARRALAWLARVQDASGGWGDDVGAKPDSFVTAWVATTVGAAAASGYDLPGKVATAIRAWYDRLTEENYYRVGYQQKGSGKVIHEGNGDFSHHETLTGGGVWARRLLGEGLQEPRISGGRQLLVRDLPRRDWKDLDYCYWHFGSLGVFGGGEGVDDDVWKHWWTRAAEVIPALQEMHGCRAGSWLPVDRWSREGGRVYATAINALTLMTVARYRLD